MGFIDSVIAWYDTHMSYGAIMGLMTIESSFIPFPSEVVIPPAAYVAGTNEALAVTDSYVMNVALIVIAGTAGAIVGAVINYLLSMWLGRAIIYKFADSRVGHAMMLSSDKVKNAEAYFNEHGAVSTFVGRLIPGIRQLISIPAGLARMPFGAFIGYTALGAGIWNTVLAILGYVAHGQAELIQQYNEELSIGILAIVGIVAAVWALKKILNRRKHASD